MQATEVKGEGEESMKRVQSIVIRARTRELHQRGVRGSVRVRVASSAGGRGRSRGRGRGTGRSRDRGQDWRQGQR